MVYSNKFLSNTACLAYTLLGLLSCGQNDHLTTLSELSKVTSVVLTTPALNFNEAGVALEGSCGPEAANGRAVVTTNPSDGFSPFYNTPIMLDANGTFSEDVTWEVDTNYDVIIKCSNSSGAEVTTETLGPVGVATLKLDNPGNLFLGKVTNITGRCSPLITPVGDVTVDLPGLTPSSLVCPCSSGTFNCPGTVFTTLPSFIDLSADYSGTAAVETGYGSCPPYTPPTNSGRERYYARRNIGRVAQTYTSSNNFNGTDSFGLRRRGTANGSIRTIPGVNYVMNDNFDVGNQNQDEELTFSGVMINFPNCQNRTLYGPSDTIQIRYRARGVGRYAAHLKEGPTPNGAPFIFEFRQFMFTGTDRFRTVSVAGDITPLYSRLYFVDDRDSAQMQMAYRFNATGAFLPFPNFWMSDVSSDANTSILGLTSPTALDDSATGTGASISTVNILANDSDNVSLDTGSLSILQNANAATEGLCSLGGAPDFLMSFAPVGGFVGTAECVYRVCDDEGICDAAKVKFTY